MEKTLQKLCIACGKDVAGKKRVKNNGNYYCAGCYLVAIDSRQPATTKGSSIATDPVQPAIGLPEPDQVVAQPPADSAPESRKRARANGMLICGVISGVVVVGYLGVLFVHLHGQHDVAAAASSLSAADDSHDVLHHPELLLKADFDYSDVTLGGIRIGDPESAINSTRIRKHKNDYGWIECNDGCSYRIENGKVSQVRLEDSAALAKLKTSGDPSTAFGNPTRTTANVLSGKIDQYDFDDRHLLVSLHDDRITGINIFAEPRSKAEVAAFAKSCEPFVSQVRALQARLDSGINYVEFREKMGSLTDTYAQIGSAPNGDRNCSDFSNHASKAMDAYKDALRIWESIINDSVVYTDRDRSQSLDEAGRNVQLILTEFDMIQSAHAR